MHESQIFSINYEVISRHYEPRICSCDLLSASSDRGAPVKFNEQCTSLALYIDDTIEVKKVNWLDAREEHLHTRVRIHTCMCMCACMRVSRARGTANNFSMSLNEGSALG